MTMERKGAEVETAGRPVERKMAWRLISTVMIRREGRERR